MMHLTLKELLTSWLITGSYGCEPAHSGAMAGSVKSSEEEAVHLRQRHTGRIGILSLEYVRLQTLET